MRHVVGGRQAAIAAVSALMAVGGVMPVTAGGVAAVARSTTAACTRAVRSYVDALQPRDLSGGCVTAAAGQPGGAAQHAVQPTSTCVQVPGVNDRCSQWMTPISRPWIVVASPSDGRVFQVGTDTQSSGGSYIPELTVDGFGSDGHHLWNRTRVGQTYLPPGGTTPQYGGLAPITAAVSPDGNRLYVLAALYIGVPAPSYDAYCGYEGLLLTYWTPTGQEEWSVFDNATSGACSEFWTSLAVDPKRIYVAGGSNVPVDDDTAETAAYDAVTGELVWRVTTPLLYGFSGHDPLPANGSAKPIITESRDGRTVVLSVYVYELDEAFRRPFQETIALSSSTGAREWLSRYDVCPQCAGGEVNAILNLPQVMAATDDTHVYSLGVVITPTIQNGTVYQTTGETGGTTTTELVRAEALSTGHLDWTDQVITNEQTDGEMTWLGAVPGNRMVYVCRRVDVGGQDVGYVDAYGAADGSPVWSADLSTTADVTPAGVALGGDGTHLFVAATSLLPAGNGELLSFDARTGSVSWRALLDTSVDTSGNLSVEPSPLSVSAGGGLVIVPATYTGAGMCTVASASAMSPRCPGYGIWAYDAA